MIESSIINNIDIQLGGFFSQYGSVGGGIGCISPSYLKTKLSNIHIRGIDVNSFVVSKEGVAGGFIGSSTANISVDNSSIDQMKINGFSVRDPHLTATS